MQVDQAEEPESVLKRITRYAEHCENEGLFPYEGQWLTVDEIDAQIRRKRVSARIQALEVVLLFALMLATTGILWLLLSVLCYG